MCKILETSRPKSFSQKKFCVLVFNAYFPRQDSYQAADSMKVTLDRIKEDTFNFWAKTFGKLMASSIEEKLSGLIERNDLRKLRLN